MPPIQELEDAVVAVLETNGVPLIWGPPGVGKSSFVAGVARKMELPMYTIIGSLCDPTDINGFPVVDDTPVEDSVGGKHKVIRFAPRDFLLEIVHKYSGRALIFWDEFNNTSPSVQAAELKTILTKEFGDFKLDPSRVCMIAASNAVDDAANGQELSPPMVNRLAHFDFPVGDDAAFEWAGRFTGYWGAPPKVGLDPRYVPEEKMLWARACVASFIRKFPSLWHAMPKDGDNMHGWPSPRSWDRVSRHLGYAGSKNRSPLVIAPLVQAEVGAGAAIQFQTYMKDMSIPEPEDVIKDPDGYAPSGRVDIDFATMIGVSACVVARPTPDRVTAGWKVAVKLATATGTGGESLFESASYACLALADLFRPAKMSELCEKWWPNKKDRDLETGKFVRRMAELTKPFNKIKNLLSGLTGS